MDQIFCCKIAL